MDWVQTCPEIEVPFVNYYWNTGKAFGLPDQRVYLRKPDTSGQIVYGEHRKPLLIVKYKTGIRRFKLDDAVTWAHRTSGRDNCVLWHVDVEPVAVIDELAGDRGDDEDEDAWDLPRADRRVTDITYKN